MSRRLLGHDVTAWQVAAAFAVLGAAVAVAVVRDVPAWAVPLGIVVPDLAFLAGAGSRPTAPGRMPPRAVPVYNLLHRPAAAMVAVGAAVAAGRPVLLAIALAWLSHIVWDRAVGYRLRDADGSIRPPHRPATTAGPR